MPLEPNARRWLVCAALLLAGCGGETERPPEGAPPAAGEPAPAAPPASPAPPAAPGGATDAYVDRGVCPFECCVYGEWKALEPVEAYVAEGDTSNVSFRVAAGERFTAHGGNVHLDPVGLAVARRPIRIGEVDAGGPLALEAGDTVEVLAPIGEGFYRMRRGGRVVSSAGFWEIPHTDPDDPDGELLRRPEWEWWVEIESADGRRGWLEMRRLEPGAVWGADACAGPEPGSETGEAR